ncbi:MAG: hypothetical protein CBB70_03205 [Planctomycetaceae bacterium TMED10]|nr:MAG: hypothetical protein CBB70_03205 [Planctomycetaceae bacterium TMED10]
MPANRADYEFTMLINLVNKPSLLPLSDQEVPILQFVLILTIRNLACTPSNDIREVVARLRMKI